MDYVTSDLHFGDEKVLLKRKLEIDISSYNQKIIENINTFVKENDTIYILGDLGINNFNFLKGLVTKINGHKILLKGNHDKLNDEEYLKMGFEKVYNSPIFYKNNVVLSHYPLPIFTDYFINIHGHLHGEKMEIKNYFNVSVDMNYYRPVDIKLLTRYADNLKKVEKKFGNEWYFEKTTRTSGIKKYA